MDFTPAELVAIELSLRVAVVATLASLPFGVAVALLLARGRFPGKTLVDGLVHLPLVLPPVVTGYLLLIGFGRRGPIGAFLEQTFGLVFAFRWTGAALASAIMGFPLLVRTVRLSIESIDRRLEDTAASLGARASVVFATVTLPLVLPGLIAGAVLSFARAIGEFGATITFVSNIPGRDADHSDGDLYGTADSRRRGGGDPAQPRVDRDLALRPRSLRGAGATHAPEARRALSLTVTLKHRRGDFDLDVAFETGRGVTALFGRSGAGKTTVVTMVAGLARPQEGRIVLDGRVLFDSAARIDLPTRRRKVGMVFQEARLFPHLSVKANLLYGRWAGWRRSETRFESVLSLLGLEQFLQRRPHTLSGGEAQRVAIGRALMAAPDMLLMDEPLSNLDGARRAEILPFLEKLAHEGGVPILYVSHQVDEVARLANSIVVLSEGRVLASGPIEDVFGRVDLGPATGRHEAGAVLVAEVVGADLEFALTRLRIDGAELVVPAIERQPGAKVRLRVRSQDVALALSPPEGLSIRNVLPVEIVSLDMEAGADAEVLLSAGRQYLRSRITRKSAVELELKPGLRVFALIKSIAVEAGRPDRG